jgi:hypothetical protein
VTSSNDAPTIAALPAVTVPVSIPTGVATGGDRRRRYGGVEPCRDRHFIGHERSAECEHRAWDSGLEPNAVGASIAGGHGHGDGAVSDGLAQSAQSFLLTVTNVVTPNNPPTLASLANLTINEDAGAQTVLLTGISSGGENQTVTVTATATPPSLIPGVETVYVSPRTTGTVSFATAPICRALER